MRLAFMDQPKKRRRSFNADTLPNKRTLIKVSKEGRNY